MKIPSFVKQKVSLYSVGGHMGYLAYFFNDLSFNRDIPKEYKMFMMNLVYQMYLKDKEFEHVDLKKFLNNPPNKDKILDDGYMDKDKFYKMLNDKKILDFFNERLDYLIDLPEPPQTFTKEEYKIMQNIQDSAFFIPVVYDTNWIPYSMESKYHIIGYLLGHKWTSFGFQTTYLEENVVSLIIKLKDPIVKDYNKLELFLSNPFEESTHKPDSVIQDFASEKPNVFKLSI